MHIHKQQPIRTFNRFLLATGSGNRQSVSPDGQGAVLLSGNASAFQKVGTTQSTIRCQSRPMDEQTADAVFGNVGSMLVFQVGARDAETLAEQLGGDMEPQDLMTLPRSMAYMLLLIHGMPSRPFSMTTMPPTELPFDTRRPAVIRRTSRHRYCRPAEQVEREMAETFAFA